MNKSENWKKIEKFSDFLQNSDAQALYVAVYLVPSQRTALVPFVGSFLQSLEVLVRSDEENQRLSSSSLRRRRQTILGLIFVLIIGGHFRNISVSP